MKKSNIYSVPNFTKPTGATQPTTETFDQLSPETERFLEFLIGLTYDSQGEVIHDLLTRYFAHREKEISHLRLEAQEKFEKLKSFYYDEIEQIHQMESNANEMEAQMNLISKTVKALRNEPA